MKIIHTSDLHLIDTGDERWDALLRICEKAEEVRAELLLISGDLFDRKASSGKLRGEIRKVFRNIGAETVIIPGNHDIDAFEAGLDYGARIAGSSDEPVNIGNVDVWGIPYLNLDERKTSEYILRISQRINNERLNILLFHGELLDSFFSGADYGGEEKTRYMPVRLSVFETCGFDYIVAGHFHTSYQIYRLGKRGYFIYPGSPVSITSREVGQRYIGMIDTENAEAFEVPVETVYYERCEIKLDPYNQTPPEKIVLETLDRFPERARVILTVGGFVNSRVLGTTEEEIVKRIEKISSGRCYLRPEILLRDVGIIYENPLFVKICEKIDDFLKHSPKSLRELPQEINEYKRDFDLNRIKELLVRVFMEAEI